MSKNDEIDLYAVTADYRPNNPNKHRYYIRATSKKHAREIFLNFVTWLKIYKVELCDEETKKRVLSEPGKYLFR